MTFPTSSVQTLSAPASRSIRAKTLPRSSSPKGGAGISVNMIRLRSASSSVASACAKARWTAG